MSVQIQLRRGTASQWTTANPVLAQGEVGVETDTNKAKVGDGTTAWSSLPYFITPDTDTGITQLTGDVTAGPGNGSQAATIASDAVTNTKLANVATSTFKGRATAGTGDPEDLSVSQAKTLLNLSGTNTGDQTITLTGDVTGSGTGSFAATIANDAVTFAKMQNMSTNKLLGRGTASTGDVEEITLGTNLSLSGTTINAAGGSPGGSTTHVQFNNAGSFGGDSNHVWDNTLKFLGVQTSSPETALHAAGVSGQTVAAPASASATATIEVLVDAPSTYTVTQVDGPIASTSISTVIGDYIDSMSGGSGSDVQDMSGAFIAQNQTWYYKLYACRLDSGLRICHPTYSDIQVTDTFNDSSNVRVDLSGWTLPMTYYDALVLVRTDSLGSPEASIELAAGTTSYTDYGFTSTDSYVISAYSAAGQTQPVNVWNYKTINGSNYKNTDALYDNVNPVADSSGLYFYTVSTISSTSSDGQLVQTYNGNFYDISTNTSFIDYGQSAGAIGPYTNFQDVFFPYFSTTLAPPVSTSTTATFNYGSGSFTADNSSWSVQVYSYRTNPVNNSIWYNTTPDTYSLGTDDNSSNIFNISGSYTPGGDSSGELVIIIQNGTPVASTFTSGGSFSINGPTTPDTASPDITTFTGISRSFQAFGKQNSPVKYSSTHTDQTVGFTNPLGGYAISHAYTGIGNADVVKVKQIISGTGNIGFSLNANPYFQSQGGGEGDTFTPQVLGYIGSSGTYNYTVFATKTINGSAVWSATGATASVTLPNDSNYYTISLTNASVSGATYKAKRQINSGAFVYQTYSSSPLSDTTLTAWNSSSTVTPTASLVPAAIFDRASTATSDPANILVRNTQDGGNQTLIDFQAKQGSAYTSTAKIGTKSDGTLIINNTGDIGAGNIDFGPYSSPYIRFGVAGNYFNVQGAASRNTTFYGASNVILAKADNAANTFYFGNPSLNYDPSAAVAIQTSNSTDTALLLYPNPNSTATDPIFRVRNSSATDVFSIDQVGRLKAGQNPSSDGVVNIAAVDSSHVQLQFASNSNLAGSIVRGISTQGNDIYWSGAGTTWRKFNTGLSNSTSTYFWRSDSNGDAIADNSLFVQSGIILNSGLQILATQGVALSSNKDLSMGSGSAITGGIRTNFSAKTASATLNAANDSPWTRFTGSTASQTLTLPTAASLNGIQYGVINDATVSVTVATTSSQTISTKTGTVTSVVLQPGDRLSVVSDGSNWRGVIIPVGQTANTWTAVQTLNDGKLVLAGATSGTTTLKANATAGTTTITFPAATDTVAVLGTAQSFTATQTINADLKLGTAGNGLYIKEGTNATMGVATLTAGTVTVSTTKVTANSRIQLTAQSLGTITVPAALAVSARTASTSFTILSSNLTDTSVVAWVILEPSP